MGGIEGYYCFEHNFSRQPPIFLCVLLRLCSSWEQALASLLGCSDRLGSAGACLAPLQTTVFTLAAPGDMCPGKMVLSRHLTGICPICE